MTSGELHFGVNPFGIWGLLACMLLLVVVCLRVLILMRIGQGTVRYWSAACTILAALLLAMTVFQPELHRAQQEETKPVLLIVEDQTDSMHTRDVDTGSNLVSRTVWAESFLSSDVVNNLQDVFEIKRMAMTHGEGARVTDFVQAQQDIASMDRVSSVLWLSDGGHNAGGSPLAESTALQQRGMRMFAVTPGQTRALADLSLAPLDLPAYTLAHEPLSIPWKISSTLSEDVEVELVLKDGARILERKRVRVEAGDHKQDTIRWVPKVPGQHDLSLSLSPHPEEELSENNEQLASIEVRDVQLKVLLIEREPRWEFRYLRNALIRDPGVTVDCLLLHPDLGPAEGSYYLSAFPETAEELSDYDVVFLGDVGPGEKGLTPKQLEALENLVRLQGSGLVFLPGEGGHQQKLLKTGLSDLLPVEYDESLPKGAGFDEEMHMWLTSTGRKHLLTRLHTDPSRNHSVWKQLPGFHWFAPILRSRVGSEVLATHSSRRNRFGRIPMLVVRDVGAGKTLVLGMDSAWRWRWGLEDVYHYRFWGQVVRWMAHKRHMFDQDQVRLFLDPERPEPGEPVQVTATLLNATARAGLNGKELKIQFTDRNGGVSIRNLRALTEDRMSWGSAWVPPVSGDYGLRVTGKTADQVLLNTTFTVDAVQAEQQGRPVETRLLQDMCRLMKGRVADHHEAESLLQEVLVLPDQQQQLERVRLWQHPLWITGLIGFFSASWILRKRQGWI